MSIKEIKTTCKACHCCCDAIVTVEDGTVTKIRPNPESPVSRGYMCPKGLSGVELLYHPKRLNYPMKRVGERGEGKWERITWDEAYDMIVANIQQTEKDHGMESVMVVQGTGRHHFIHTSRFTNAIGTPNWMEPGQAQCYQPRVNASMITYGFVPVVDYYGDVNPECVLVWGHNPVVSNADGEMGFLLEEALKKGTTMVVIDPKPTELAKKAKLWLRIRPGTDCALALAMLHVIINEELYDKDFVEKWSDGFETLRQHVQDYPPSKVAEITWLKEEDIIEAARLFANASTGGIEWGCALDQTPNAFDIARAIALLPGITGKMDVPGGFVCGPGLEPRITLGREWLPEGMQERRLGMPQHPMLSGPDVPIPSCHIPTVFHAMETGDPYPVETMLLFGNNCLVGFADATNTRELFKLPKFLCCMDLFMTPTAELCDVVLPAACWLEYDAVNSSPATVGVALLAQQKIVRLFERKADEEVYYDICQRLGKYCGWDSFRDFTEDLVSHIGDNFPQFAHVNTFEDMCEVAHLSVPMIYRQHEANGGFRTPTGKMEIKSTILEKYGLNSMPVYVEPPESPYSTPEVAKEYPIILTTGGRSRYYFLSEGRHIESCRKRHPDPQVEMSPELAAQHGIEEGDWVWIESPRGKITQRAKLIAGMSPQVVNCQHGWWFPEDEGPDYGWKRSNANILTNAAPPYGPAMGTYQLRALLCRIYK